MSYIFTSESVSAGHPDKICDQISDAVLMLVLPKTKTQVLPARPWLKITMSLLAGEITTTAER